MCAPLVTIQRALVYAAGLAPVITVACGQPHHPPPGDDDYFGGTLADASTREGGILIGNNSPTTVPTCALGPEGGVCDCIDQPLLGTPPTLYFVLDRSGSMSDDNKWEAIRRALFDVVTSLGPRAQFGAAVFPSPTSQDSCAPGIEVFAPLRGDSPAGTAGPIETAFFDSFKNILASGGTPTDATLQALYSRLTSLPGVVYVILATDGGPNCNGAAECDAGGCTINIDVSSGCPAGGPPNCCAVAGVGSAADCLDSEPTLQAVQAIADAGIPVYIMGIPGSAPYASLLDQLAQAGGTARGSEPLYYAVGSADQGALQQALSAIAATVTGTCTLTLNSPPIPTLVNVFLDEQPLAQSGPDGWTLDGSVVTVLGASCQQILAGSVLDVRVVVGCPTYIR
jgi:hypothetical protein